MSDYGLSFGVRNSGEDAASREGRLRIPASLASTLRQGDYVIQDFDNMGFVKVAPTGTKPQVGIAGINVQSSGWTHNESMFNRPHADSTERGGVKAGLTAIWSGNVGIKLWYKNLPAQVTPDGRSIAAVTRLKGSIAAGNYVSWDASDRTFVGAASDTNAVGRIAIANGDGSYAEIVFF